jgi:glycosyltransferase involved in cell wall biosynthesis
MPLTLEGYFGRGTTAWVKERLMRHPLAALPGANVIITVSECVRGDVIRVLDFDPGRVVVVPNMVRAPFAPKADAEAWLAACGIWLPPRPRVLSVGHQGAYKNLPLLIRAMTEPGLRAANLVRVGSRLRGDLAELASRRDVLERTTELGYLDGEALAAVYSACDALAQPSLYEGFGVPVLEAMACGLPVVCSNGGALPEVVGDAGLVVPLEGRDEPASFAEAIERVLNDGELARRLRAAGLERARAYEPARVIPRLVDAYRCALAVAGGATLERVLGARDD